MGRQWGLAGSVRVTLLPSPALALPRDPHSAPTGVFQLVVKVLPLTAGESYLH